MSTSEPVYLPRHPSEAARVSTLPPPPALEEDQTKLYDQVLAHFSSDDYVLPGVDSVDGKLTDAEKFWLSNECLCRYLRASKWKLETAIHRLEVTLKWRREYGLYTTVTSSHVEPEAITGKEILFGYDVKGRPGFYMIPSRQNTDEPKRQVEFAVWMLERSIDLMGPGVESIDLLINFAEKAKNPSLSTARTVLNILQEHYPERLGLALIINVPYLVNLFFKMITPFIDPVTRNKMKFNPDVVKDGFFAPNEVMSEAWGGDANFKYEHDKYWPELVKMCEDKAKAEMEKWKELGGRVGIREWDYKDGKAVQSDEKVPAPVLPEVSANGNIDIVEAKEEAKN